jgi:hypothetical protein
MTVKEFVRKILVSSCVICTLISVFFYLVAAIVNGEDETLLDPAINLRQFLLILLFSLLVALANRLLSFQKLHIALRIAIHYATLLAAFLVVFVAAGKLKISGPSSVFLSVMIFTVLYAVCFVAGYFLLRLFGAIPKEEKKKDETPYRSRFH